MFDSRATRNLTFVSRRLSGLLEDHGLEEALGRISEVTPEAYEVDIERLRSLLSGSAPQPPSIGPAPFQTLLQLLPAQSDKRSAFFRGFVDYIEQNRAIFEAYWAGITGLLWYLAGLCVVAVFTTAILTRFVLRPLRDFFLGFGEALPMLTQLVTELAGPGAVGLVAILALFMIPIGLVIFRLNRSVQRLAPISHRLTWIPLLGRLVRVYNQNLFLNFTRILRDAEVPAEQAVKEAARAANVPVAQTPDALRGQSDTLPDDATMSQLWIAARLGQFDDELAHHCADHVGVLVATLSRVRDRFSMLLKLLLFLFIGTLIVAMYLPIFKLGTIV